MRTHSRARMRTRTHAHTNTRARAHARACAHANTPTTHAHDRRCEFGKAHQKARCNSASVSSCLPVCVRGCLCVRAIVVCDAPVSRIPNLKTLIPESECRAARSGRRGARSLSKTSRPWKRRTTACSNGSRRRVARRPLSRSRGPAARRLLLVRLRAAAPVPMSLVPMRRPAPPHPYCSSTDPPASASCGGDFVLHRWRTVGGAPSRAAATAPRVLREAAARYTRTGGKGTGKR